MYEAVVAFALGGISTTAVRSGTSVWRRRRRGRLSVPMTIDLAAILAEAGYPPIPPATELPRWTEGEWADVTGVLPTAGVLHFADQKKLNTIGIVEAPYIAELAEDILANGIREPLQLVVDVNGDACLKEGHHRLTIARNFGIPTVPVRVREGISPGIRKAYHRPLHELVPYLRHGFT